MNRRRSLGPMNGADPPPLFFVSVDSTGDEVVCFHTDLKVLILMGVGFCGEAVAIVPAFGQKGRTRYGKAFFQGPEYTVCHIDPVGHHDLH